MIVDDAYFMRNLIKKHLKEAGYDVVGEAKNGKEGIKFYFELKPDIVTMDINMPDMSGIEVTKQILSKDPNALIIAVTGNNDDDIKRQIIEAGVKEYLQKPFQPSYLWNKINKMLETHDNSATPPSIEDSFVEDKEITELVIEPKKEIESNPVVPILEETEIEDNFDNFDDLEIEILNEPDKSKPSTLVIENEEDIIEYPVDYQDELNDSQKEFILSKDTIEKELEIEDNPDDQILEFVVENGDDEDKEDKEIELILEEEPIEVIPEKKVEKYTPISEPKINTPSKPHVPPPYVPPPYKPKSNVPPPYVPPPYTPKSNVPMVDSEVKNLQKKDIPVPQAVTYEKSTKQLKKGVAEITIKVEGNYKSSSKAIDIRPPRAKILNDEYPYDDIQTNVDAPILNDSDSDKYNDKETGLFGVMKKLFKK